MGPILLRVGDVHGKVLLTVAVSFCGGPSWTFPELLVRTVYFASRWKTVASLVALPRNFLCVCLVEIPKHPHGEFIVPLISGNDWNQNW